MTFFHRHRWLAPWGLLTPGMAWLVVFFVVPLGFLAYQSLQSGIFPNYEFTWEFSNYREALSDNREQLVRSFWYAGIATVLALAFSYPLAYWIAFRAGKWKNVFLVLVVAPFFVTYLIRTIAWQTILSDDGAVVGVLRTVGLLADDGRLLATSTAVVAGITYNYLPFAILPIYVSLEQVDRRLVEAAEDLYASPRRAFLRVTLPLSLPGVFAATVLTFIPAAGDFINAELLGGPNQAMIGNVIQSKFLALIDYPSAAALSFVLMAHHRRPDRDLRAHRRLGAARMKRVRGRILDVYAILAIGYMLLPIAVVILFSFNNPAGRFNYVWQSFTFDNWVNWDAVPGLRDALETSLLIAVLASVTATALGTLIALALVRHQFRGRAPINFLIFLPMAAPEIVLGASLLTLFLNQTLLDLGFWTIFIAHVMFCISFVVVTVRARLVDFDRHLEEAAADLGATGLETFRLVTLPLLWPAILAGGLLAFAISVDDFVITYFNSGSEITFPVFVWGQAARGVPPQVNVIGSAIFLVAVGIMLVSVIVQTRRRKETAA